MHKAMRFLSANVLILVFQLMVIVPVVSAAGTPYLVKDINPGSASSRPHYMYSYNGKVYFLANDGVAGNELWSSDGTAAGTMMVKDINPGSGTAFIAVPEFITYKGMIFFMASNGTAGQELWKSDGTETGTVMVKDINPGSASSTPQSFAILNDTLYFDADDGVHGHELWKSDGTESGTVIVADIRSGSNSSGPYFITNLNGTLFFTAYLDAYGSELWKSDGTASGTVMLKDINPGTGNGAPTELTVSNGKLFFGATTGVSGDYLWMSDGTTSGTVGARFGYGYEPLRLIDVNGILYFCASSTDGYELYRSDGAPTGTYQLKDINPGSGNSAPDRLTNVNGTLFFTADNGVNGRELWKSDGTESGTIMLKDIYPGSTGSYPLALTNINGTLYFGANDGSHGMELWRSDGTASGTVLLCDINPGSAYSAPGFFALAGNKLCFSAYSSNGEELWALDLDIIAPSSSITYPLNGSIVDGVTSTITGTADDGTGSGVKKVNVSTDGGATWQLASGTNSWSYTWTPPAPGSYTILSRATDNDNNVETPGAGVTVTTGSTLVITEPADKTVNEGELLSFTVSATDAVGYTLTFSSNDLPEGATLDPITGAFRWTPGFDQAGVYVITITVYDGVFTDSTVVNITVVNVNRPPSVTAIYPSSGICNDRMLELHADTADPDGDTITAVAYEYSADGGVTWNTIGEDDTPDNPYHWNSGLDDVSVYLRARAFDGTDWGQWYYNSEPVAIENSAPILISPPHGTVRPAACSGPPTPPVFTWEPNKCTSFTVYFSAEPFGNKSVKLRSDNMSTDSVLTVDMKDWIKITEIGSEVWWWVSGISHEDQKLFSNAFMLVLDGGFTGLTDIIETDAHSVPVFGCDPGTNITAMLQFSKDPSFGKTVDFPGKPVMVGGSRIELQPDSRTWDSIIGLNRDVNWRFTGMLSTGETTFSPTMTTTITGGPVIDGQAIGKAEISGHTIYWQDDGGFKCYIVQASCSPSFADKKPVVLGKTKGDKVLTLGDKAWDSLVSLGDTVYVRVVGTTDEGMTLCGPSYELINNGQ